MTLQNTLEDFGCVKRNFSCRKGPQVGTWEWDYSRLHLYVCASNTGEFFLAREELPCLMKALSISAHLIDDDGSAGAHVLLPVGMRNKTMSLHIWDVDPVLFNNNRRWPNIETTLGQHRCVLHSTGRWLNVHWMFCFLGEDASGPGHC